MALATAPCPLNQCAYPLDGSAAHPAHPGALCTVPHCLCPAGDLPEGHPGPARGTDCYTSRPWGRQWDCGCDVTYTVTLTAREMADIIDSINDRAERLRDLMDEEPSRELKLTHDDLCDLSGRLTGIMFRAVPA